MSYLSQIEKPKDRPIIATITGDAGVGKTTLACAFPKPIVIRAEDGLQSIPKEKRPDAMPIIHEVDELWAQLKALIQEKHDYKTVVIDSVTALERLFVQYVIDSDTKNPKSINQAMGGYGAGPSAVGTMHHRVRKACGVLNEKVGMHVVFVAHADMETVELPDSDPYSKYSLRLGKKSQAPYTDDSDVVGFVKLETFTKGEGERKKAISNGTRILITEATASNITKNRYGITQPLEIIAGENPLAQYISSLKTEVKTNG